MIGVNTWVKESDGSRATGDNIYLGYCGRRVMNYLNITIPEEILLGTGLSREEFIQEARFLLLAKLFELGRISSGKAATMCDMNRIDFILAAGRIKIPVIQMDDDELRQELSRE